MLTADSTIFAARILTRPGLDPAQSSASIAVSGGLIEKVTVGDSSAAGEAEGILAMPALGNGHDHGRGVKFLAFGVQDKPLEAWVPAFYARPSVDAYKNGLLIMCRMARSGIASAVHCHQMPQRPEDYEPEIEATAKAAHDVGMRLGLVMPLRDRNPLCYGSEETILSLVHPADRDEVARRWKTQPLPPEEQVARAERLAQRCTTDLVNVQLGPIGVQWASDRLLQLVAEASDRLGLRVHMHLLESRYQREWLDATYPQGVIGFLDEIGLLSPRLTVAHGVWLRSDEMELLASRGVIVSLNTSCNLRLGSGMAPARELVSKGVPVALGLDGLALDDDDDALREMRMADVVHRGPGFAEPLPRETLFAASMKIAPLAVTGRNNHGALEPGMAADIVTLDYAALSHDVIDGMVPEADLVLARGTARFVRSLWIAGRKVVDEGRVIGIDHDALERDIQDQISRQKDALLQQKPVVESYQDAMRRYYQGGYHLSGIGARQE